MPRGIPKRKPGRPATRAKGVRKTATRKAPRKTRATSR